MKYCDSSFKKDREFVLASKMISNLAYLYIDNSLKSDEEILKAALLSGHQSISILVKKIS